MFFKKPGEQDVTRLEFPFILVSVFVKMCVVVAVCPPHCPPYM